MMTECMGEYSFKQKGQQLPRESFKETRHYGQAHASILDMSQ